MIVWIRSLGPTESARPSHASARSRQSCGEIPAPICGNLGRFLGLPIRQRAKSCSKVVSVGGRANSVVIDARRLGPDHQCHDAPRHDDERRLPDLRALRGRAEALSAIMAKDLDGTGVMRSLAQNASAQAERTMPKFCSRSYVLKQPRGFG